MHSVDFGVYLLEHFDRNLPGGSIRFTGIVEQTNQLISSQAPTVHRGICTIEHRCTTEEFYFAAKVGCIFERRSSHLRFK
jgi:hypothetical protein